MQNIKFISHKLAISLIIKKLSLLHKLNLVQKKILNFKKDS